MSKSYICVWTKRLKSRIGPALLPEQEQDQEQEQEQEQEQKQEQEQEQEQDQNQKQEQEEDVLLWNYFSTNIFVFLMWLGATSQATADNAHEEAENWHVKP